MAVLVSRLSPPAPDPSRALPCTCQRVFDPLDSLFAIELVTFSYYLRVLMRGFAPAGATRGVASGLHKGLRPLTLSRDAVEHNCILVPRVNA